MMQEQAQRAQEKQMSSVGAEVADLKDQMSRLRLKLKDQRDELQSKARRTEADLKSDLERREKEVQSLRTELYDTRAAAT